MVSDGAGRLRRVSLPLRRTLVASFALLLGLVACLALVALFALSQVYQDARPLPGQLVPTLAADAHYLQARQRLVLLAGCITAVGVLLAILLCNAMGRGLEAVAQAAERLAAGEDPGIDLLPAPGSTSIAGRLTATLIHQSAVQSDIINLAERIAGGELPSYPLRRCKDDPLGTALEAMVTGLSDINADRRMIAADARDEVLMLRAAIEAAKADARQVSEEVRPAIVTLDGLTHAQQAGAAAVHSRNQATQAAAVHASLATDHNPSSRPADPVKAFALIAKRLSRTAPSYLAHGRQAALQDPDPHVFILLPDPAQSGLQTSPAQQAQLWPATGAALAPSSTRPLTVSPSPAAQATASVEALRRQSLTNLRALTALALAEGSTVRLLDHLTSLSGAAPIPAVKPGAGHPDPSPPIFASRRHATTSGDRAA